jgi:hypothetical protein
MVGDAPGGLQRLVGDAEGADGPTADSARLYGAHTLHEQRYQCTRALQTQALVVARLHRHLHSGLETHHAHVAHHQRPLLSPLLTVALTLALASLFIRHAQRHLRAALALLQQLLQAARETQ